MKIEYDGHGQYVAVFRLSADDCDGIADALGDRDAGGEEMRRAADELHQHEDDHNEVRS